MSTGPEFYTGPYRLRREEDRIVVTDTTGLIFYRLVDSWAEALEWVDEKKAEGVARTGGRRA